MYIEVGSVTTATRLAKLLERNAGVPAAVARTPSSIKSGGCSYSVRITGAGADCVKQVVESYGINIKAIYEERYSDGERVFYDIS